MSDTQNTGLWGLAAMISAGAVMSTLKAHLGLAPDASLDATADALSAAKEAAAKAHAKAQEEAEAAERRNVLHATPFPHPINPFSYGFELLQLALQATTVTPEQAEVIRQRAGRLRELANRLDTEHTSPILLTAMVHAALTPEDRAWMLAVLRGIEEEG